jgi:hypothetical protein
MSEYQYYEFRAIDRRLTQDEMRALRALSSRAQITPTGFVNFYTFGSFKGNPDHMVDQYFDAFLYYANWGTRRLMFRLPRQLVEVEGAAAYCPGHSASLRATDDFVVLEFTSDTEPEDEVGEDEEEALASLIPVRAELLAGDLRPLYLGWLLAAQMGDVDDEEEEPPVPPGLGRLSGSQESFAEFLRIDPDLIAAAAERSDAGAASEPSREEWGEWIRGLPRDTKDALLLSVAEGGAPLSHLRGELLERFQRERGVSPSDGALAPRTVGELLAAAEKRAEERRRREAEQRAAARARQERQEAAARAAYLERLEGREDEIWERVEALIASKKQKEYDQAVPLLQDLRDLAARASADARFQARLQELRERHAAKVSMIARLDKAGLGAQPESAARR